MPDEDLSQPLDVDSYYGTYDASDMNERGISTSLNGPKREQWPPPPHADRNYSIGVLFPHMKDPYWLAVNYGIIQRAQTIGISIRLLDAGDYKNLGKQREQLTKDLMAAPRVDGIILASISYDALDAAVAKVVGQGVPVVEVINDIHAPDISAKALVSFYDMGYHAGEYVLADSQGRDITVAFLPGPEDAGWAPESFAGFQKAIEGNPQITVLDPEYGAPTPEMQTQILNFLLSGNEGIDYIVCNAVAASAAVDVLEKHRDRHPDARIVGTYIIPEVYDYIRSGKIAAAPTDLTVHQGHMSVDMIVRILNGETPGSEEQKFPFRSGPVIETVTTDNIGEFPYEDLFGMRDFNKTFKFDPDKQ